MNDEEGAAFHFIKTGKEDNPMPKINLEKPVEPLGDEDLMPFGKYKGSKMKDVPSDYLDWLIGQAWLSESWPRVSQYILKNIKDIQKDIPDDDK